MASFASRASTWSTRSRTCRIFFDDGHSGNMEGDAAKSVIVTSCALIFAAHSKANKHIIPDEIILFLFFWQEKWKVPLWEVRAQKAFFLTETSTCVDLTYGRTPGSGQRWRAAIGQNCGQQTLQKMSTWIRLINAKFQQPGAVRESWRHNHQTLGSVQENGKCGRNFDEARH